MTLELQPTELATPVARALGKSTVDILDWHSTPLTGGGSTYAGGTGIYRVAGPAQAGDGIHHWSMILKMASGASPTAGHEPGARNYWRREAIAYQSGLLGALPGEHLVAPHCWAVQDRPGDESWIWLEEIQSSNGAWSLDRYHQAARHLGQFNGAYLAGYPLPVAQPWMTRGRTRVWIEFTRTCIDQIHQWAEAPLVRRWFGPNGLERILDLWSHCPQLLAAFERLPVCYCHHDAHRRNLLERQRPDGTTETVAIDWALTGFGRIGEEAGVTMTASLELMEIAANQAQELDQAVFSGYIDGLHDAGWAGDVRLARLGYTVNACLGTVLGNFYFLEAMQTAAGITFLEAFIGQPLAVMIEQWAETLPFCLDRYDEALALAERGLAV